MRSQGIALHPRVSCIVPVYNGERYLNEALQSIFAQSFQPMEVIVVDDGSTDGTATVTARHGARLRYFHQPNSGPASARNLGLKVALGEFIAFLDADDVWHVDKLKRQVTRFEVRPELDLCVTNVQNFWNYELREEQARYQNHRFSRPLPGYCTQALLARRVLFEMVGPFNSSLRAADDTEWFLRAAERKAVMECVRDVLVYRRLHPANLSRTPMAYDLLVQIVKDSLERRRLNDEGVPQAYRFPKSTGR